MAETRRTPLSDGGYVLSTFNTSSVSLERFDAAGQRIGRIDPLGSTSQYDVTALSSGGFVVTTTTAVRYGFAVGVYAFDAQAARVGSATVLAPMGSGYATAMDWNVLSAPSGFAISWAGAAAVAGVAFAGVVTEAEAARVDAPH